MKNVSTKLKLVIFSAIGLIALLLIIAIAQLISYHVKKNRLAEQQGRIDKLAQTIAGHNPPNTNSIQIKNVTITFEE